MTKSNEVLIDTIREKAADRRSFMRNVGMASAGLGAFLLAAKPGKAQAVTDVDILQFALNLEYLESEFYTMATTGKSISEMGIGITGSGNTGATTGGKKVTFIAGSTLALSATEIASDERNHVKLIRGALTAAGVMPIAKPAINLDALGIGFGSQEEFITLARAFEDVGVSAYGGAAPLISSKAYLGVAARILAAEALHTGNLRLHAALYQVPIKPVDEWTSFRRLPGSNSSPSAARRAFRLSEPPARFSILPLAARPTRLPAASSRVESTAH